MKLRMFTFGGAYFDGGKIGVEVDGGKHLLVVNANHNRKFIRKVSTNSSFYTFEGVLEKDITEHFIENFQYNEILEAVQKFLKETTK